MARLPAGFPIGSFYPFLDRGNICDERALHEEGVKGAMFLIRLKLDLDNIQGAGSSILCRQPKVLFGAYRASIVLPLDCYCHPSASVRH